MFRHVGFSIFSLPKTMSTGKGSLEWAQSKHIISMYKNVNMNPIVLHELSVHTG